MRARFRAVVVSLLAGGALLLAWTAWLNARVLRLEALLLGLEADRRELEQRIDLERRKAEAERDTMRLRIEDSRRREEELRQRLAQAAPASDLQRLETEFRAARARLASLEIERAVGERIIRDYGPGVCLIQGSYGFYDSSGRPLRKRLDAAGRAVRQADGSLELIVSGDGPPYTTDYYGTGFLVDRRGLVITNRHIAEPWWKDDSSRALDKQGYKPRLLVFRAFFPKVGDAFPLALESHSPSADLTLLRVDLKGRRIPVLPLDASAGGAVPGQPVVVVGYPSGIEAILAKADAGVVERILSAGAGRERLVDELGKKGLIRPSTTQGHIGDVTGSDIVFDAATTQGGSGGPVFNKAGRVIAVEYAVLSKSGGNSFALPVRYAVDLLRNPRT